MESESPGVNNILQIKQANGEYAFVCSDNWNANYANMICKRFGYSHSRNYSFVEVRAEHTALIRINNNYSANDTILKNLHATNTCDSNTIVQLTCDQYGKIEAFDLINYFQMIGSNETKMLYFH